jgi:hypothetical protein
MAGDSDVHDASTLIREDQQHEQESARCRRHHDEIGRRDLLNVEHVELLQPDRLDGEEIDGQYALAVYARELAPRHLPALTRWSKTRGPEPPADWCR